MVPGRGVMGFVGNKGQPIFRRGVDWVAERGALTFAKKGVLLEEKGGPSAMSQACRVAREKTAAVLRGISGGKSTTLGEFLTCSLGASEGVTLEKGHTHQGKAG